jgi:hypothetical protein
LLHSRVTNSWDMLHILNLAALWSFRCSYLLNIILQHWHNSVNVCAIVWKHFWRPQCMIFCSLLFDSHCIVQVRDFQAVLHLYNKVKSHGVLSSTTVHVIEVILRRQHLVCQDVVMQLSVGRWTLLIDNVTPKDELAFQSDIQKRLPMSPLLSDHASTPSVMASSTYVVYLS